MNDSMRAFTFLAFLAFGCTTVREIHCDTRQSCESLEPAAGITLTRQEQCWVRALSERCDLHDQCVVKCLLSGEGREVAGGCWHLCGHVFAREGGKLVECPASPPPDLSECDSAAKP